MIFTKMFRNENGVSEVVGAMLILLILVVYLGIIQAYEVPRWNKELEKQEFDRVYSDFLDFRSNLEDVSMKSFPKTSSMHMGVRYPERFMLRNPGQGSYGIITTYPLNISISYSGIKKNFTSMGIVYEMKGLSQFPKLVYENGIVIKDYGYWGFSDDENHIITNDSIFVPLLLGIEPASSIEMKTVNIFPIPQKYYSSSSFSSMDLTIETRYPEIWANMSNASRPSGSRFSVDRMNRSIKINDIFGYDVNPITLPNITYLPFNSNRAYIGMIPFGNSYSGGIFGTSGGSVNCNSPGKEITGKGQGCIDIQNSETAGKFIIQDIALVENGDSSLRFSVRDYLNFEWTVDIKLKSDSNGTLIESSIIIDQKKSSGPCTSLEWIYEYPNQINLTSCFINQEIKSPNVLSVEKMHSDLLHVNFLIT